MWWAGEMASAMRSDVNVVSVACDDYEVPTDEVTSSLSDAWGRRQLAELCTLGGVLHHIQGAYK